MVGDRGRGVSRTRATVQRNRAALKKSNPELEAEDMIKPLDTGDAPAKGAMEADSDTREGSSLYPTNTVNDLLMRTKKTPHDRKIRGLFDKLRQALQEGLEEVIRLNTVVELGEKSFHKKSRDLYIARNRLTEFTRERDTTRQLLKEKDAKILVSDLTIEGLKKQLAMMTDSHLESLEIHGVAESEHNLATTAEERAVEFRVLAQLNEAKEASDRKVARLKAAPKICPDEVTKSHDDIGEQHRELERVRSESAHCNEVHNNEVTKSRKEVGERDREVEGMRSELERFKQKVLSDEFYNQRSLTPEGRRAIRSAKRRRVDSAGQAKFVDDIDKLTDQMQERVKEELQKELAELHSYRKLVEQTAREQFSIATTLLQPTDVTAEGYYQVMNLLEDSYRVAMGIAPIKLSNDQWVKLLEGLPTEGKEVLPRMLWEQRLEAEHPKVCNVLLGGLFNLHACHLMSAQEWAMDTHQRAAAKIIKLQEAQPIPGEEIGRWKGLAAGARNEVQQRRGDTSNFLDRVDEAEVRETQIIGARRMRWVFREAGWDAEGQLECPLLDKLKVPDWAIDYKKPPPARPLT